MRKKPLAVVCGDLHLQDRPPAVRRNEKDWFGCMERQLKELVEASNKLDVPLILAGDVFDHYSPSPRLLNLAISVLKNARVYSVYGQHDMKNHDPTTIHHTGYGTLIETGAVLHLSYRSPIELEDACLLGFSWEEFSKKKNLRVELEKLYRKKLEKGVPVLAVSHAYAYLSKNEAHEGSSFRQSYRSYNKFMHTFCDAMLFGDNHKTWKTGGKKNTPEPRVPAVNTGCIMRRTVSDLERVPVYAIWNSDRTFRLVEFESVKEDNLFYLSVSKDVKEMQERMQELAELLKTYTGSATDASTRFREGLESRMRELGEQVAEEYSIKASYFMKGLRELLNDI